MRVSWIFFTLWFTKCLATRIIYNRCCIFINIYLEPNLDRNYLGCFNDTINQQTLPERILVKTNDLYLTVDYCLDQCFKQKYNYAILKSGSICFCSRILYGLLNKVNECDIKCMGNINQTCGGQISIDVYNVQKRVPGIPQNIYLNYSTLNSISLVWAKPFPTDGVNQNYKVALILDFSFNAKNNSYKVSPEKFESIYNYKILSSTFYNLCPASRYLVTVRAGNTFGYGKSQRKFVWTKFEGTRKTPSYDILSKNNTHMLIKIESFVSNTGPISAYRIVICNETKPDPFIDTGQYLDDREADKFLNELETNNYLKHEQNYSKLKNDDSKKFINISMNPYSISQPINDISYERKTKQTYFSTRRISSILGHCYITAHIQLNQSAQNPTINSLLFMIGDNMIYGGYLNKPLNGDTNSDGSVYIGVVSGLGSFKEFNDDIFDKGTKVIYSFQTQDRNYIRDISNISGPKQTIGTYPNVTNSLVTLLTIVIVLAVIYGAMRWSHYRRSRMSTSKGYLNEASSSTTTLNGNKDLHLSLMTTHKNPMDADQSLLEVIRDGHISTARDLVHRLVHSSTILSSHNFTFTTTTMTRVATSPHVVASGKFGAVYRGRVQKADDSNVGDNVVDAAILICASSDFTNEDRDFLELARALKISSGTGSHPNFLNVYGMAFGQSDPDELWIGLEPTTSPTLLNLRDGILRTGMRSQYIERSSSFDVMVRDMLGIALGLANGLRRLEELNIAHPKLAAKNIWVDRTLDHPQGSASSWHGSLIPKIGALGFQDYSQSLNGTVGTGSRPRSPARSSTCPSPRWSAPEYHFGRSLTIKATTWSFGVVLWEIFTLGATPYSKYGTADALRRVKLGTLRLDRPGLCMPDNDELYQLLLDCWLLQPEERPNMATIISNLESFALNPQIYMTRSSIEPEPIDECRDEEY